MTMLVAECLVAKGWLDADDLARRFVAWLPDARGAGRQTRAAVESLSQGSSWQESGGESSGIGAAMRVAPIGLLRWNDPVLLRAEAILSALPTHRQSMGVASAVATAAAVAWLLTHTGKPIDATALITAMRDAIAGIEAEALSPRNGDIPTTLAGHLGTVPAALAWEPEEFFATYHNGAFVLETLPAALYCFLHSPTDVEATLLLAVNAGYDVDTVAAIAGTWGGAWIGEEGLPQRLLPELEYRDDLCMLADALYAQSTASIRTKRAFPAGRGTVECECNGAPGQIELHDSGSCSLTANGFEPSRQACQQNESEVQQDERVEEARNGEANEADEREEVITENVRPGLRAGC